MSTSSGATRIEAGSYVGPYRRRGRRYHRYAIELGGGLFENVHDDRVTSIGIEPVGEVVIGRDGRVSPLGDRRPVPVLVWAAPLAGAAAAAAAGAVAGGIVRHRRRAA